MTPESFHFLRPGWLLAAVLVVPAIWAGLRSHRSAGAWRRVCDPELLAHLVVPGGGRVAAWPLGLLALGWLATSVALAGPTWQRLPQPSFKEPTQTALVLDLSAAMAQADVAPSRFVRARYELLDLLGRVEGAVGLVVFAEEPFAVTPLTDDPRVIAAQVPLLSPGIMPGRGAGLDRALDLAHELLDRAGASRGRIVLLAGSVGDDPAASRAAASRAADAGYPLSVLGVGGDPEALAALAAAGEGRFAPVRPDDRDVERVLAAGAAGLGATGGFEASDLQVDAWRDMGAWLVLVPLALAPFAFRRGWAGALMLLLVASAVPPSARAGVGDWFVRPDQRGADALAAGATAEAAELFEDRAWRGVAEYRSGDYESAVDTLSALEGVDARFNLGNALARASRLEQAIAAYDQALELEPGHADARYNRDLVQQLLEQQERQEQQEQQEQQSQPQQQEPDPSQSQEQQPQSSQRQQPTQPQSLQQAGGGESGPEPEPEREADRPDPQQAASEQPGQADAPQPESQPEPAGEPGGVPGELDPGEAAQERAAARRAPRELSEEQQELEQWLNRVPDDPAGLLREKLRRRYLEKRYGALRGGAR